MIDYPLFKVTKNEAINNNILDVLETGAVASGSYVNDFEHELSQLTGHSNFISTSDLTSAMEITLKLANVEPGDEVIASPFSCLASNSPIAKLELLPKWVDFLPDSVNVNVEHFKSLITDKTKVAVIYHLAGYPSDLSEIAQVCKKNNIFLVEDCNNALLAEVSGSQVGQLGDAAIYSFYANRQLHSLEGGAIGLKSDVLANKAKKLRKFGIDFSDFRNSIGEINPLSDIEIIGFSATLSNLNASVAMAQISMLKNNINDFRGNASLYQALLSNSAEIKILEGAPNSSPVFWVFLIKIQNRNAVISKMKSRGVHVSSLHQMNNVYSCFSRTNGNTCIEADNLQNQILALPCGWWLNRKDIKNIVAELLEVIKQVKN